LTLNCVNVESPEIPVVNLGILANYVPFLGKQIKRVCNATYEGRKNM